MSDARWLSVKEAAAELGVGQGAIYQLVAEKRIPCYRLTPNKGRIRFKAEDLVAYAEASRVAPKSSRKMPKPEVYIPKHSLDGPTRRH